MAGGGGMEEVLLDVLDADAIAGQRSSATPSPGLRLLALPSCQVVGAWVRGLL